MLAPWKKGYYQPRQHIKKQRHHFVNKGPSSQNYCFTSSHVRKWELDHNVGWAPKNWCFWTMVLEKTLESPLDCRDVQPFNPRGTQPWLFILWPPDGKSQLIGKDPDAGKDWRQERKGQQRGSWLDGITRSTDMGFSKLRVTVTDREAWHAAVQRVRKSQTQLSDWIAAKIIFFFLISSFRKNVEQ